MKKIHIYTDSSKSPYNNVCGIAYIVVDCKTKDIIYRYGRQEILKSNNRGELLAIVEAVKYVKDNFTGDKAVIYCDNKWCVNCINKLWKPKVHLDLFEEYHNIKNNLSCQISVFWIKGHNGNLYNNEADALANYYRQIKIK